MKTLAFALGFYSLLAQVLLMRELAAVFLGHELTFNLALAAWLLWTGAGSFRGSGGGPPEAGLRRLPQLAAAAPLCALLIRVSKLLTPPGSLPGLLETLAAPFLLLAPACWLSGASFAALTRLLPASSAYFWESAGAFAGGLAATFLVVGRLPALVTLCACGMILAALAWRCAVAPSGRGERPPSGGGGPLAAAAFCAALALFSAPMDDLSRRLPLRGYALLAQREGRYEHLALAQVQDLKVFFENGVVSAHFPDRAAREESVHWPLLEHPSPRRVLALGAAAAPALCEILKHPVERVDLVEADGAALGMLRLALDAQSARAFEDARVRVIEADPRQWVRASAGDYDVILQMHPEPMNAAINRLFTREFFVSARRALAPGGLLALGVPSAENYLSPESAYANASVWNALASAFPSLGLIPGGRMTLLASDRPVSLDAARLAAAYRRRGLENSAVVPQNFPFYLDAGRRDAVRMRLQQLARVPPNEDLRPAAYFLAWRVWLVKFVLPAHFLGLLAFVAAALWGLGRLWAKREVWSGSPKTLAVMSLGFAGMVSEVVFLLAFQIASGALYWRLGLLFAAFMGGLAAGSGLGSLAGPGERRAEERLAVLLGTAALGLLACAWLLPDLVRLPEGLALACFSGLLALGGAAVGLSYPLACPPFGGTAAGTAQAGAPARLESPERVYAADLWGSALGAFLAAAFLVPLAGMRAALVASAAALVAPIVVLLRR